MRKYKAFLLTLALISGAAAGCQTPSVQSIETVQNAEAAQNTEAAQNAETAQQKEENFGSDGTESEETTLTLDQQVSKTILEENAGRYASGECAAEGHQILKTEEKDGETKVYVLTMYGEYQFHNGGYFVKSSGSGVIPAVITYEKGNDEAESTTDKNGADGKRTPKRLEWPEDGSGYTESIEEMFPEELWKTCISPEKEVQEELEAQERAYAERYLKKLGREAEIGDYGDFPHTILTEAGVSAEVSNRLLDYSKELGDYPMWIGTLEKIEDGVRYVYEKKLDLEEQRIYYNKTDYETGAVMETYEFDSETGEMISGYKESRVEAVTAAQPGMSAAGQPVNPIKDSSPEEFKTMGITLELPENENWIQEVSYTTISGEIAQIQYYDAIAEADMTLRAGRGEVQEIAGIYYSFDDSREEEWVQYIRVQHAVADGKDVGVLASWSDGDFTYTLWGDFVKEENQDAAPIAKTAAYVAEHSQK